MSVLAAALPVSLVVSLGVPQFAYVAVADTPAQLVANGDFETPRTSSVVEYYATSSALTGWTVGGDSVDLVPDSYWAPNGGRQSLDLAGSASGSVHQTVATTPGTTYTLSWALAGNTNCGQRVKTLDVRWNGALVEAPTFDASGATNQSMGWSTQEVNVTATGTASVLEFADATPDGSRCGAALDDVSLVVAEVAPPKFTRANPALKALQGAAYSAIFYASGVPEYHLADAPAWLSISAAGAVTGTPPAGTTSFSYRVSADNALGSAVAGPYTVAVSAATSASGHVVDGGIANTPVAGAIVDACATGGGGCQRATTAADGSFGVAVPVGSTVVVSAYPRPGSGDVATSTQPLSVPEGGIQDVTIALNGVTPLTDGLKINGTSAPTIYWSNPSNATLTGCANGYATVTVTGLNTSTGRYSSTISTLTETPDGSGSYAGTIPPQQPVHGPVDVHSSVMCGSQSPIAPDLGPASGGTGFTGATAVTFGGKAATGVTVLSDGALQAVAPPGTGTVPVAVVTPATPDGTVVDQYTYLGVDSLSPVNGPAAGGTWVTITGAGLGSATQVLFGDEPAQAIWPLSDTRIQALSPPGTGTVDVTVDTLYAGATAVASGGRFTYGSAAAAAAAAAASAARPAALAARPRTAAVAAARPALAASALTNITAAVMNYIRKYGADLDQFQDLLETFYEAAEPKSPCETGQMALRKILELKADAFIDAATVALIPIVRAAVIDFAVAAGIASAGTGLLIGAIVYALVPYGVHRLLREAVETAIEAIIKDTLGPCPPNLPEPPDTTYPPGGVGPCVLPDCGRFHGNALIDPSGNILDTSGNPVAGATATILRADTAAGPFTPVDAASPGIQPAVNPETTGTDGGFHWDVVSGWYEVRASAPGCTDPDDPSKADVTIGPLPVPPPQLGLVITLACPGSTPPVPAVTALSRATGSPAGGTTLTVTGSGFTPASTVQFGTAAATAVTYLSPQVLTVTSPPGTGAVDVTVHNGGSASAVSAADKFVYGSPPALTGLSVTSGSTAGGTAVTITGSGFGGTTAVLFGGLPATSFTVRSDTTIDATAPAQPAGTVDVAVVTPIGASPPVAADRYTYQDVPPVFTADTPPATATVGQAYTYTYVAAGSPAPTYSVASGALPPGLSLAAGTGVLSGTPTTAGAYTFTVAATGAGAPAVSPATTITVGTPGPATDGQAIATGRAKATARITTAAPGDLIIAFVAADGPSTAAQKATVSGGGLTWKLVRRTNTRSGTAEVWVARATGRLSGAAVTATLARSGFGVALTVVAFSNATGVGHTAGASGRTGAPSAALTATAAHSWVYGVGNDWTASIPRTVGAGQKLVSQSTDAAGDTYWVQQRIAPTAAAGAIVTINDTAPTKDMWNLTLVEVI